MLLAHRGATPVAALVLAIAIVGSLAACAAPSPWNDATPDDGSLMDESYMHFANEKNLEALVELGDNDSMPWAVLLTTPDSAYLFVAYVTGTGPSCGSHLGLQVTESADAVVIAAVSSPPAAGKQCGTEPTFGGGYIVLSQPLGGRTLYHAKTSAPWNGADSVLPTYIPQPEPSVSPTSAPYSGDASCASLLDAETTQYLLDQGLSDYGTAFSERVSTQPDLDVYAFLDHGGILCGWGDDSSMSFAYGYGPIAPETALATRSYLVEGEGGVESQLNGVAVVSVPDFASNYAFGVGYWAVTIALPEGVPLSPTFTDPASPDGALMQIVANAPQF